MITWQNRRIETSVMVLVVAVAAVAVARPCCCGRSLRAILRSPDTLRFYLRMRRGMRGYHAVSQGLVAVGSGDARAARKFADEAARIAPHEPLTLLLTAQASQLAATARRPSAPSTPWRRATIPGCSGCTGCTSRRSAATTAPPPSSTPRRRREGARAPAWAGLAVFDARCAAGDWVGALERLDRNMKSGLVDRDCLPPACAPCC